MLNNSDQENLADPLNLTLYTPLERNSGGEKPAGNTVINFQPIISNSIGDVNSMASQMPESDSKVKGLHKKISTHCTFSHPFFSLGKAKRAMYVILDFI